VWYFRRLANEGRTSMDDEDRRELGVLQGRAIEAAKANRARIDGSITAIERLFAQHEIVYLVWPCTTPGRGGYELMAVKGAGLVRGVIAKGQTHCASVTGIPCDNYEQAAAIQRALRARGERLVLVANETMTAPTSRLDDDGSDSPADRQRSS
jgi:hypothetical protein